MFFDFSAGGVGTSGPSLLPPGGPPWVIKGVLLLYLKTNTPLLHAEAVGVHAVRYAIKGLNGVMPIIVRSKSEKYSWKIIPAPLSKIANVEKKLPNSFISKDGFDVTAKAIKYLKPLIQGEAYPKFKNGIPHSQKLKLVEVKKKLPNWKD